MSARDVRCLCTMAARIFTCTPFQVHWVHNSHKQWVQHMPSRCVHGSLCMVISLATPPPPPHVIALQPSPTPPSHQIQLHPPSSPPAIVACYFGEGAASEGDFHAALNFAATLSAPVLFICRNNGWAISTPATEQYRGDGIAGRGPGYGMATIRVDGGDARAVYNATAAARAAIIESGRPVLLECMSYRSGHHSTSDDSTRYRTDSEMKAWRARDPVARFARWMTAKGWWDEQQEKVARAAARREAVSVLEHAEREPKPSVGEMFDDGTCRHVMTLWWCAFHKLVGVHSVCRVAMALGGTACRDAGSGCTTSRVGAPRECDCMRLL